MADVVEPAGRRRGRWRRGPCPRCSATRARSGDDALATDVTTGWWRCWRCGAFGRDARQAAIAIDPARELEDRERLRSLACRLFVAAKPIELGDAVDRYLRSRALRPIGGEWPTDLRHHRSLRHPSGHVGSAMVAIVRDVAGRPVALARTWLDSAGQKAEVRPVRMTLGASQGSAVRLGALGDRGELGIAEGIEDALAVMQLCNGLSCFATLGASGMRALVLPIEGRCVVVVPDRDEVGAAAGRELAERLRAEGRDALVRWPRGKDANDDVRAMESAHGR